MATLSLSIRAAALERCLASAAGIGRCNRRGPSRTRSICNYCHRAPSSRQHQLLLQADNKSHSGASGTARASIRTYVTEAGTNESTIQGTVGKGASGVAEEAQKVKEGLQAPDYLNEKERMVFEKLDMELEPVKLEVQDISGGCGSMYGIEIVSERFRGLSMLKQQRLVNEVLGEEIKSWHGVQLKTKVPS